MKQRLLALAVGVLVPLAARAADLPVSYSVEQTPLKPVLAGTSLTFELYNDARARRSCRARRWRSRT